jgi:hypothetical protein
MAAAISTTLKIEFLTCIRNVHLVDASPSPDDVEL